MINQPGWDVDENKVAEQDDVGCIVTHNRTRPDLYFVMDEVLGNINQKR